MQFPHLAGPAAQPNHRPYAGCCVSFGTLGAVFVHPRLSRGDVRGLKDDPHLPWFNLLQEVGFADSKRG